MVCTGTSGSSKLVLASEHRIDLWWGGSALWIVKGKLPVTIRLQQTWHEWAIQEYLE